MAQLYAKPQRRLHLDFDLADDEYPFYTVSYQCVLFPSHNISYFPAGLVVGFPGFVCIDVYH